MPQRPYEEKPCKQCGKWFGPSSRVRIRKGYTSVERNWGNYDKAIYCSNECAALSQWAAWREAGPAPSWYRCINSRGYVEWQARGRSRESSWATSILEHRLVVEKVLGRPLLPTETVHHRNTNKLDNDLTNLELWASRHIKGMRVTDLVEWVVKAYPFQIQQALQDREAS